MSLTRRELLIGTGAAAALGAVLWWTLRRSAPLGESELTLSLAGKPTSVRVSDLVADPAAAHTVGAELRRVTQGDLDPQALARSLFAEDVAPDHLRPYLQRRIRADFEQGRTVEVRGWVLAETEAKLYLLIRLAS